MFYQLAALHEANGGLLPLRTSPPSRSCYEIEVQEGDFDRLEGIRDGYLRGKSTR